MVAEGTIDSMSVVFASPTRRTVKGVPTVVSAELLAVDFVSIPSNRDARVISVRGFPATPADVMHAIIAKAESALDEMDAIERIASDPVNKMYRLLAEAADFLSGEDQRRTARRTLTEAESFLGELNRRS